MNKVVKVGFIGLFDTVASVGGLANFGYVRSPSAPGVKLHLPASLFPNVVHLVAGEEIRANFALNRTGPDHPEIFLPGVHSNVGGGYRPITQEQVLISPMLTLTVPHDTPLEITSIYKYTREAYEHYLAMGWPAEMLEIVAPTPKLLPLEPRDRMGIREKQLFVGLELKRQVRGELSRVYLRVMHALAKQKGVPFKEISEDPNLSIPEELKPLCDRFVQGDFRMTAQEKRLLKLCYIHTSAHWNPPTGLQGKDPHTGRLLYVNAPVREGVRVLHPHVPERGRG
ncbi:phospholipase effector Tle1 domain-containing protein [Pseudomonas sp. R5(2019)]|uniref:phospholipase effector Tle1 domain-containing protein n=1 Tax=Pseudomonas sp. R5(2019) TaxID=2697566 RepID=UPI001411C52E|nr:hypothetical protein [Pseudomonas sp. R5(2019)]